MFGIVLGSGFDGFVDHFTIRRAIPYDAFMDQLPAKVEGHAREILVAESGNQSFLIFSGRLHFYEGISPQMLIAPYQFAMQEFGMEKLVITSASGGLQDNVQVGEWQQIIRVLPFPEISQQKGNWGSGTNRRSPVIASLPERTYAFQQGPSLGTPAEYKALHRLGADLVGMSIHPERTFFNHTNLDVWYWSLPVVSYIPLDNYREPTHQEVLAIARKGVLRLVDLFTELLNQKL